jgi:hypothetical protein
VSEQAATTDHPLRMPLITRLQNRDETLTKDAKLVNCFVEKDEQAGDFWVEKRLGLAVQSVLSGAGMGIFNWNGNVYSIFNGVVYKDGVGIGAVDNTNGKYRFQQIRGNPGYLVMGNGTKTYYTQGSTVVPVNGNAYSTSTQLVRGYLYTIKTLGTTDFTTAGASSNVVGTVFIANGPIGGTGTAALTCGDILFTAGSFVVGNYYVISTVGTTNFTLIGAAANTAGLSFKATGVGAGTGTAYLIETYTTKLPVIQSGAVLVTGRQYVIWTTAGTDWTLVGAASNTPGLLFTATGQNSLGAGLVYETGNPLVQGNYYTIDTVGTTDFTLIGAPSNTPGITFLCTGISAGTGTVFTQSFPGTTIVKGFAYLDGTLYVMDDQGQIWGTLGPPQGNFDDPSQWDPLNVIVARDEPDAGVFLWKQQSYVIAFKEWTTEAFYDAGNPTGSPLSPVIGAKTPYGCVSGETVQEIDDTLIWVTANRMSSPQVVMMQELRARVISTPQVERLLDTANQASMVSFAVKHGGHRFYVLTIYDFNLTLVFDLNTEFWFQWTDKDGNYWPLVDRTFDATGKHIVQARTGGTIYYIEGDYDYPTDAGDVVPVDIITPNTTFGVDRRKTITAMHFNGDQTSGSNLYVRVNDKDYDPTGWTNFRVVDMGQKRPMLYNCGTFYRRAWHLRHMAPTPFRIKWVDLQMDLGTL